MYLRSVHFTLFMPTETEIPRKTSRTEVGKRERETNEHSKLKFRLLDINEMKPLSDATIL